MKTSDAQNKHNANGVTRRFLGVYQLLICALIIAGIFFTSISIISNDNKIEQKMMRHSRTLKNVIKNEIDQIEYQLSHTSSRISLVNGNHSRTSKLLSPIISSKHNSHPNISLSWNAYSWIDRSDRIVIDGSFGILDNKLDVSSRDYLRFTKFNPGKIYMGKPIYGMVSQRLIVPIAVGTFSKRRNYLGTLVFGFDIEKINSKLKSEINDDNISFLIFKEGRLLFSSGNITKYIIDKIENKVKILSLEEGDIEKKLTSQSLIFGRDPISIFKKTKNFPIEVVAVYDRNNYKEQIINLVLEKMIIIFLLAILFFILFKILYLRIIKPVSHLSEFAKQISQRNFHIKIQKPLNRELTDIYDSLDSIGQDFAKEESMTRQLIEINKKIIAENISKNDFFQAICQDIRSPIFSIASDIKSLEKLYNNKKTKPIIDNFNENIADILQLTEDLLDISQTSSGSININKKSKVDVTEVIDKSIGICLNFAKKHGVSIKNNPASGLKKVNIDPKRLKQILVNILIKSIISSKKEGSVNIRVDEFTRNNKEKIRITVAKDSSGVSFSKESDNINEQLQKFTLVTDQDKINSLNINLKHTKDLIKLMGGVFEIEFKKDNGYSINITFDI